VPLRQPIASLGTFTAALLCASAAMAADITVYAHNEQGAPLAHAVVSLHGPDSLIPVQTEKAEMSQIRTQFQPHVLVIRSNSRVAFPNLDSTRHQVYSFSRVKRFVTRLYAGREADPVIFDRVGLVPIGCHIHDRMQAFIYVTDAPMFGVTDASGKVIFKNLPVGDYDIEVLHPWQKKPVAQTRSVRLITSARGVSERVNLGAIGADPRISQRPVSNPLIRSNPFAR
jgi:plastocyanin